MERNSATTASGDSEDTSVNLTFTASNRSGHQVKTDETVTLWVGAYDDSEQPPAPLPDTTLDVTIERPDGETDEESVETDQYGSASLTYDLSETGREDGQYDVTVEHPDGASRTTWFSVGPYHDAVTGYGWTDMLTGKETTVGFRVRDGASPLTGVEYDLEVTLDDETIEETTETTDDAGFVAISFTPDEPGEYGITGRSDETGGLATQSTAFDVTCGNHHALYRVIAGEENTYSGYLRTASGHLGNEEFDLRFVEDESDDVLLDRTITTNEGGFFAVDYEVPEDIDPWTWIDVELEKDGRDVPATVDRLVATTLQSYLSDISFSVSTGKELYAPGETVAVEIEAADDGEPISDEEVRLLFRYRNRVPVYSATLITDEEGRATDTFSLHEDAPHGADLVGVARLEYSDDVYEELTISKIQEYEITVPTPALKPGEAESYEIEATDVETGDPVEGIPHQFELEYATSRDGLIETGGLVTGADGTDETTISVPDDVSFRARSSLHDRYRDGGSTDLYPAHPGEVTTLDSAVPGEEFDVDFDAPGDAQPSGIVFAGISIAEDDRRIAKIGAEFEGEETVSLQIPDYLEDGDLFELYVWAADEDGTLYSDLETVDIHDESGVSVTATGDSIPVGGEAEIDISAHNVDQVTVEALWLDWEDLADADLDGGTPENRIAEDGTYEIEWDEIEEGVSPSLTVEPPEDTYVGGTYVVTVTGTDGENEDSDTAIVEIE